MAQGLGWLSRSAFVVLAGYSIGLGLSGLSEENVILAVSLLVMASAGEWLEVRLRPSGAFTLRPVIAFVGLWSGGPALLMLTGLLPILLVRLPAKRSSLPDALALAGGDALGLWLGYVVYLGIGDWVPASWGAVRFDGIIARAASFLSFWAIQMPLQALNFSLSEGVRYRSGLGHLMRQVWPHVMVLLVAAIALSYVETNFELIVMGIATVVLIEAYYPWKLLGDQGGVLLTSLQMMAQAVDLKDPYTSNHSQRVSRYAVRIEGQWGCQRMRSNEFGSVGSCTTSAKSASAVGSSASPGSSPRKRWG